MPKATTPKTAPKTAPKTKATPVSNKSQFAEIAAAQKTNRAFAIGAIVTAGIAAVGAGYAVYAGMGSKEEAVEG